MDLDLNIRQPLGENHLNLNANRPGEPAPKIRAPRPAEDSRQKGIISDDPLVGLQQGVSDHSCRDLIFHDPYGRELPCHEGRTKSL